MTETTWSVSIAFGWRPEDEPTPSSIVNSHARPFCGSLSGSGPVTVARGSAPKGVHRSAGFLGRVEEGSDLVRRHQSGPPLSRWLITGGHPVRRGDDFFWTGPV